MSSNNSKYLILFCLLFLIGCASTQSSIYKTDNGQGWQVNVIKKAGITDEFVCTINDSVVVSDSFPLIGDNFEKSGQYRGRKVMMNGYKSSTSTTNPNGTIQTHDKYQIRVFIDNVQVDKFDF